MLPIALPLLAAAALAAPSAVQPPAVQPSAVQPRADTVTYVVVNHGRPAGDMRVLRRGDSLVVRYQHVDRNRGQWVETRHRLSPAGEPIGGEARPFDRRTGLVGEPTERFAVAGDSVRWEVRGEPGGAPLGPDATYRLRGGTPHERAALARWLLARPDGRGRVVPGTAPARAEIAGDTVVPTAAGPARVRLAMVHRGGGSPAGVWLDADDELFASDAGWFITVRAGAEAALPALRAVELAYRERAAADLARRLARPADATIVVRGGDVFDSERGVVVPRTSILIRGDRIVAVGPADSIAVPAGATVIDATGRTVVPGLWDMHTHAHPASQTTGGLLQLAQGITTTRDLASDPDLAVSLRDRADAGTIVSPRVLLAGFLEGPGAWAGPSEAIVATAEDARRWIARYDSLGYRQIKLYNLVHPDLVPGIAADAHARGLRLSGHVPRGMSVPAALALGFDEINHAAFLFSTFFPDSLYLPEMRAYSAVATAVAPSFDVDGPAMTALIDALRRHGTVIDGTFNLWAAASGSSDGTDAARARGTAAYLRLIRRLHDAGVTLVPGTDNSSGATYHTELELYERAGIPAPTVLQMATITSARVMGDARDHGSLAPGKVADLVIVDGRPAERVADLRRVVRVMRGGRHWTPAELRDALRDEPRP